MEVDLGVCQAIATKRIYCPRCGEPVSIVGFVESITHEMMTLITCLRCYPGEQKT